MTFLYDGKNMALTGSSVNFLQEFLCKEIHTGSAKLECDDACKQAKDKKARLKEEEQKKKEEEEKKRQQVRKKSLVVLRVMTFSLLKSNFYKFHLDKS